MNPRRIGPAVLVSAALLMGGCGPGRYAEDFVGTWKGDGGALRLESSGKATGDDGCNSFGATWKTTSRTAADLVIGQSTMVACSDAGWASEVTLELVGGQLIVEDEHGDEVARLTRTKK